jgi:crotonobetainyl-CoA:carnitine CoA-transferase CaiB-like acyl-CoA transferase
MLAATMVGLRLRDATGQGQLVESSLFGTGIWVLGYDYAASLVDDMQPDKYDRTNPANPLSNSYLCRDGGWLIFAMAKSDLYWPSFCEAIERTDLLDDPRFQTLQARREHSRELTSVFDAEFAKHDRDYWAPRLNAAGVVWSPAATLPEVAHSEQASAMGIFNDVSHPEVGSFRVVGTPFRIHGSEIKARGPAPGVGDDTHEVLLEAGFDVDEIGWLAERGVFG